MHLPTCIALAALLCAAPASVASAHEQLLKCVQHATRLHAGKVERLELKLERQITVYELEVRRDDGSRWDIECDASNGVVIEIEESVTATDPRFRPRIRLTKARAIALAAVPGTVLRVEFELEPDGNPGYEFHIEGRDGKLHKVEVDGTTGNVLETAVRLLQIGRD